MDQMVVEDARQTWRVCWECLAEEPVTKIFKSHFQQGFNFILRKAGDVESIWTMFCTSIVDAADWNNGCKNAGCLSRFFFLVKSGGDVS